METFSMIAGSVAVLMAIGFYRIARDQNRALNENTRALDQLVVDVRNLKREIQDLRQEAREEKRFKQATGNLESLEAQAAARLEWLQDRAIAFARQLAIGPEATQDTRPEIGRKRDRLGEYIRGYDSLFTEPGSLANRVRWAQESDWGILKESEEALGSLKKRTERVTEELADGQEVPETVQRELGQEWGRVLMHPEWLKPWDLEAFEQWGQVVNEMGASEKLLELIVTDEQLPTQFQKHIVRDGENDTGGQAGDEAG